MTISDHQKAEILSASVEFTEQPLQAPLILSSGSITTLTLATVAVRVRVGQQIETGRGSIYLSDLWSWPDPELTHEQRDSVLRTLCREIADNLAALCGADAQHPLELGLRLHHSICRTSAAPPTLARAMCASPYDAAIHDAVGRAIGVSAFALYDDDTPFPSADAYFQDGSACRAVRQVIGSPRPRLAAWCVVGKDDGYDELRPWVQDLGYRCFKFKLLGKETAWDVARTVAGYQQLLELGATDIRLSVDTNEGNPDVDSVLDYLETLRQESPAAYAALQYLEQPTARDITKCPADWRPVTALKPVMLDEGLTDLTLLPTALEQGWSGLALKTCKGHSFALTAAAWAAEHGLALTMQDLTNPGLSLIHAALMAAHLPVTNGIELNSPQYTPAANAPWLPQHQALFAPTDGYHRIPRTVPTGLGSTL